MPKYREPFTVFPRRLPSGKIVYYYRTYSPDGERTVAHSTGKTNKTLARNYCAELLKNGQLFSGTGVSFYTYAKDFFNEGSIWYKDKLQIANGKSKDISRTTISIYKRHNNLYLLPFFGKLKLTDINASHIRKFRNKMIEENFSASTINGACSCLKVIFAYARSEKLMTYDPFNSLKQLYVDGRLKNAFNIELLQTTFNNWKYNENSRYFALIGAVTGMRISEIMALRKETIFEDYIDVKDQILFGRLAPVKRDEMRKVRICTELRDLLQKLLNTPFLYDEKHLSYFSNKKNKKLPSRNDNSYIFPMNQNTYRRYLYNCMPFSREERIKRKLSFHSLRHFTNTYLLTHGISEIKTKWVMGHSSGKGSMTERYANFEPSDFDDVAQIQSELMGLLNKN